MEDETMFAAAEAATGVIWCRKDPCHGHNAGTAVVHLPYSYATKRALWRFLMAAHAVVVPPLDRWSWAAWQRRWMRIQWVRDKASEMNTIIPARMWDMERALLREDLAEYASRIPGFARDADYETASKWASRR